MGDDKVPIVTTVHECIGDNSLMALIESIPDSSCGFFVGRSTTRDGKRYYKVIVTSNEPKFKTRPAQPGYKRKASR